MLVTYFMTNILDSWLHVYL